MNLNRELCNAASNGNIIRVKLMLKLGANVHAQGNGALRWAADGGHKDVCEVLLEHGADVHAQGNGALLWAADNGHKDVCKVLLEHGANIDDTLEYAKRYYIKERCNKVKTILIQVKNDKH